MITFLLLSESFFVFVSFEMLLFPSIIVPYYRFLFVLRVLIRRTFFPFGWCFSTFCDHVLDY